MGHREKLKQKLVINQSYGLESMPELDHSFSEQQKNAALALSMADSLNLMLAKGLIEFLSPEDIAFKYGFSRQHWDLLMRGGKIPFYSVSSGKFTLDIYIDYYLKDKHGEEYVSLLKALVKQIRAGGASKELRCPKCDAKHIQIIDFEINIKKAICQVCKYKVSVFLK